MCSKGKTKIKLGVLGGTNEIKISNLPAKQFKVMVINMLTDLSIKLNDHIKNFNKERENIRKFSK